MLTTPWTFLSTVFLSAASVPSMAACPRSRRSHLLAGVLLLGLVCWPLAPAQAAERTPYGEAGLGVLSVAVTFLYGPAKVLYAGAGLLTAGAAYVLTGFQPDLPQVLITRSLRGDYVVRPENLSGEQAIEFVGRDPVEEPYPY